MKRLSLKRERLALLNDDELRLAIAGAGEAYTGQVGCALSLKDPCVSAICVRSAQCVYSLPCTTS